MKLFSSSGAVCTKRLTINWTVIATRNLLLYHRIAISSLHRGVSAIYRTRGYRLTHERGHRGPKPRPEVLKYCDGQNYLPFATDLLMMTRVRFSLFRNDLFQAHNWLGLDSDG